MMSLIHQYPRLSVAFAASIGALLLWATRWILAWWNASPAKVLPRNTLDDTLREDVRDLQLALERSREEAVAWRDRYYEALRSNLEIQEKLLAYRILQGVEATDERAAP